MISEEKVRLMTDVARFEKEEEHKAMSVCGYRRKDYIAVHMIGAWAAATLAYGILTCVVVVWAGGGSKASSIPLEQSAFVFAVWATVYVLLCAVVLAASCICYGRRYRMAAVRMRYLKECLLRMEDFYKERGGGDDSFAGVQTEIM